MLVQIAVDRYLDFIRYKADVGIIKQATADDSLDFGLMVKSGLPDTEVETLTPTDFRALVATAAKRWGAVRLRRLRHFTRGWVRWLHDEGLVESPPRTGPMESPQYRPAPKRVYTPDELRRIWDDGEPRLQLMLGLGLFVGMNCSDIAQCGPESFDGNWCTQPRVKTGISRRAYVPSYVISLQHHLPLSTVHGPMNNRRCSAYWYQSMNRIFSRNLPFTGLRTTLRTVAGHVDPEALEMRVMGHTGASAASATNRSRVGLEHYVNLEGISDKRLRSISKAMTEYVGK